MAGVEGLEPSPRLLESPMLPITPNSYNGGRGGDRTRDSRIMALGRRIELRHSFTEQSPLPYHLVTRPN